MSTPPGSVTSVPAAVESVLRAFFDSRRPITEAVGGTFADAAEALEAFVLRGGKRVRPAFAWTGWLGAGGDTTGPDADAALRACSALELVQACALVHDDIIDSSATRRGFPTLHVEFAHRHRVGGWSGDPAKFGESIAILLGDLALAWADDLVRESGIDAAAQTRIGPAWSAMRTEVLGGQYLDVHTEVTADESVAAALRINRYKTAAYTIERPLHLGAAIAGADDALIAAYREFGTDIGIAFQLQDDLLGVFGDPEVTGKPSGDDLREGKRTVLFAEALVRADASDPGTADFLRRGIGTDLSDEQVQRMRQVILDLGAVEAVQARIDDLTATGLRALDASSATDAAKASLRDMAVALGRRSA